MRLSVIISAAALLCLRAGVAFGDSSPAVPSELAEATPVEVSAASPAAASVAEAAPAAKPAAKAASPAPRRAVVTPIEPVVVSAPSAPSPGAGESAPRVGNAMAVTNKPVPGKIARQYHSAYYVNRVKLKLPAGIRVTVRKDWYSDEVILVYAANPYTNWRGVTPDAFVFRHPGTNLEVLASGTKYVPTDLTIYVPSTIQVEVN